MSSKFGTMVNVNATLKVTGDPDMKYSPDGKAITTINCVHNEYGGTDQSTGKAIDHAMWMRVTAWEKDAEFLNKFAKKGDTLSGSFRLQFDKATGAPSVFQKKDQTMGSSFELTVVAVVLISKGNNANGSAVVDDFASNGATPLVSWGPQQPQQAPNVQQQFQPAPAPVWGQQPQPVQQPQQPQYVQTLAPAPTQAPMPQQPQPQPQYAPAPQPMGNGFTVPQQQPVAQPQYAQAPQQQQPPVQPQPQPIVNPNVRPW
jgi:single-stranded DNA-binding protein